MRAHWNKSGQRSADYSINFAHSAESVYCWNETNLPFLKVVSVTELRVESRPAGFHRAAVAAEHNDVVSAVNKGKGDSGETIDSCQQTTEHAFSDRLLAYIRISIGQWVAFCFVPGHGGIHGAE